MDMTANRSRLFSAPVLVVYLAGFLQGLTLVSFPASSVVLKQSYAFTDAQYGAIFLPQVLLAVIGAVGGGVLAKRVGLQALLWIALAANALSQIALAGVAVISPEMGTSMAFLTVMLGTACMGFGFGLSGAPLNSYPPMFFPAHRNTAVVALHTALGAGLTVGPLLAGAFIHADLWIGFPVTLFAISFVLAIAAAFTRMPGERSAASDSAAMTRPPPRAGRSGTFWTLLAVAVLYAFAEGTFSNWIVIYLQEVKHQPENIAAFALAVFWGALVVGRLSVSALVLRIAPERIWLVLPVLMICAFLCLPAVAGPTGGILAFALAGLACSAFFPLTIALASKRFPDEIAWVSSMLIAALMLGVGLGAFVIGPLREWLSLEQLYVVSCAYPVAVLLIGTRLLRHDRRMREGAGISVSTLP